MPLELSEQEASLVVKLAARINGQKGGRVRNKKRAKASAENGKLGGRPKIRPTMKVAA